MARYLLIILFVCAVGDLSAQRRPAFHSEAVELVQEAEYLHGIGDIQGAIDRLKAAVKNKKDFAIAYRLLGLFYKDLGLNEEAIKAYEQSFGLNPTHSRGMYYECGEAYLRMGNYEKAEDYFKHYIELHNASNANAYGDGESSNWYYDELVEKQLRDCEFGKSQEVNPQFRPAELLGGGINSERDDFLPAVSANNKVMLFTSNRDMPEKENPDDENIFISYRNALGEMQSAKLIGNGLNTLLNEGMATLSADGRKVYFSACQREASTGGCDIFEADIAADTFYNIREVRSLNSINWESQPSLTCDGSTFYFSSRREGGFGGTDIWMSQQLPSGGWGLPVNLGPTINTAGDEETPTIALDGQTLYFSSNGHPGFGEADIYKAILNNGTWGKPENLGRSVNSTYREVGFVVAPDGEEAFFTSDRPNGVGGLDLYTTKLEWHNAPKPTLFASGTIFDAKSNLPLSCSDVLISDGQGFEKELRADTGGVFSICLPADRTYTFTARVAGYSSDEQTSYLEKSIGEQRHDFRFFLRPAAVVQKQAIEDRTYESNVRAGTSIPHETIKTSITFPKGTVELNPVAQQQLKQTIAMAGPLHQSIRCMLIAHTDGDYHAGHARVQAEVELLKSYLTENGFPVHRLEIGFLPLRRSLGMDNTAGQQVDIEIHVTPSR